MSAARDVLLISGPAGAAKTVAADEWARRRPFACAHISVDEVLLMVKSGYADPQDGWGPEQAEQYRVARGSIALMARRYIDAQIGCVIDGAIFPTWPWEKPVADYEGWKRDLGDLPHRLVILMPRRDVILERNRARGRDEALRPQMLKTIYEMMLPWQRASKIQVIDNSILTVGQTIAAIEDALHKTPD